MDGVIVGKSGDDKSLQDLNTKCISMLYELLSGVDTKTDPDMVRAITESVAKLNTSLKGSDILSPNETEEDRMKREQENALRGVMTGEVL